MLAARMPGATQVGTRPLEHPPFHSFCPGPNRNPIGHSMQPPTEGVIDANRRRTPHQNKPDSLKRVFGLGFIAQDAVADGQDHCAMTSHEGREGVLIA